MNIADLFRHYNFNNFLTGTGQARNTCGTPYLQIATQFYQNELHMHAFQKGNNKYKKVQLAEVARLDELSDVEK